MAKSKDLGVRPLKLDLALQGGGTHGAFTWGVLDRLLEEEDLAIGRISGTSAGALNGAALATGLARGGPQGAKQHLALLWQKVAEAGSLLTFLWLPLRKPGLGIWDDALPLVSPYQANPLGMAPLRSVLASVVDVDLLRGNAVAPRLFVNAVHVQTGSSRVFGPRKTASVHEPKRSMPCSPPPAHRCRTRQCRSTVGPTGTEATPRTRCCGRCTMASSKGTSSWSNSRRCCAPKPPCPPKTS